MMRSVFVAALVVAGCRAPAPQVVDAAPAPSAVASAAVSAAPKVVEPAGVEPVMPGIEGDAALTKALMAEAMAKPDHVPRTHHKDGAGLPKFVNRLIRETSPYLLQHAHNPVNWRAWGPEAFAAAAARGVPVLLSVGYSTCHWCHVMERESFEDVEIAAFINAHFVAIKVDREERPDVDDVYMAAVNILNGRGGWPMTVVMTADKRPFFGGTYFPARTGDRGSRKGFFTILQELSKRHSEDREGVVAQAKTLSERMAKAARPRRPGAVPGAKILEMVAHRTARRFDARWGGWGRAPKFPRPVGPSYLLRYHRRTGDPVALAQVVFTLHKMAEGGIYDHLGGGFHRYSTDTRWLVPHFEKMLYDQAQLAKLYVDAWQLSKDAGLRRVAMETLDYVALEMTTPEGGFYSATDADSPTPEGHDEEGWCFTWTQKEIEALLDPETARRVVLWYGVSPFGNFEGRSILRTWEPRAAVAKTLGISEAELQASVDKARPILYAAREKRPPPIKDTKVITSWNGLMIGAFAHAGFAFDQPKYVQVARRAATFALARLKGPDGRLARTFKDGRAKGVGYLDDYAFLIEGLLDLFEATGEPRWLVEAKALQGVLDAGFGDEIGGYFTTGSGHESLITREKPDYDGAEPSGNSVAALNLLRLAELTGDQAYDARADKVLGAFSRSLKTRGTSVPRLVAALDFALDKPREVVVVRTAADDGAALLAVLRGTYLPNRALFLVRPETAQALGAVTPLVVGKGPIGGRATAYVCEAGRCERPTGDPKVLAGQLARREPLFEDRSADPIGASMGP